MSGRLDGLSVIVTRARHQAAPLTDALTAAGATVVPVPAIDIEPPTDWEQLDSALCALASFDWVVFTSGNAVDAVVDRMLDLGIELSHLATRKLAAVGATTAGALSSRLRSPDVIPTEFLADALPLEMGNLRGAHVLLPQADIARKGLAERLVDGGAAVTKVTAYRIVRHVGPVDLPADAPAYLTLMSPESAKSVKEILCREGKGGWVSSMACVCVGPITAEAAKDLGFDVVSVPINYTATGVLEAIIEHAQREAAHV